MGKQRNDLIDRIQYIGLRLVSMAMHSWPVEANMRVAELLGNFMYAVDRKHRDRALGNLRRSFPDMPEPLRREMARRSMQQLFMLFVEVMFTTRLVRIDTIAQYVELGDFKPTLELLLRKDQGLIMLTGHYGNWEILGYVLATMGFETTAIARPLDNSYVNEWLLGVREKKGQRIIAKKGATEEVTQLLERHGTVGFIADQNAGSKGIFVDFFGRKASTYKSIGLLAMQYEVPVVIGYARRLSGKFRFEVAAQDIIFPHDWKDQPDPLRYITQRYTKAIEDFVRKDPGQYLWVHRRWKTRPKGEAPEAYD
jgi:Kdo2-lipid IVA lauroyltransferase/acyltransferase